MRFLGLIFYLIPVLCLSQDYTSFTQTIQKIRQLKSENSAQVWDELIANNHIPLIQDDSVAFLYRGPGNSVSWMGDFNGWGYDKKFDNNGKKINDTDIWLLKAKFPRDARLDYKILIDGSNWILDPANSDNQWSGVGGGSPNSELRMPDWKVDPITSSLIVGAKTGKTENDLLFNSQALGYQITYSIYLPPDYNPKEVYPVIYVTDGYEYMHERLGNMITILNNLIHLRKIKPIVAVFIDHREPINRANNKRMQELAMSKKYLNFLTDELIPSIEKKYKVSSDPAQRGILGTSMGGLSAAYFAFSRPGVFGLAGIQSPAFSLRPDIYAFCDNPENPPVKTFMTTGLFNDTADGAAKMKMILDKNTCTYKYEEVNQGHSWGNWRDLIDDILIYFFPAS